MTRPIIGITAGILLGPEGEHDISSCYRLRLSYMEAFDRAGAAAVLLPEARHGCDDILPRLDGLVLSGGRDIPPEQLGVAPHPACNYMPELRWESECAWLDRARAAGIPVLGICLGMQVINVCNGGTLIQDLPSQYPDAITHSAPDRMHQHDIRIEPGSRLATFTPAPAVAVTSAHHQAIDAVAPGFKVTAVSEDRVIEAIESVRDEFLVGVQWHPERCLDQPNWLLQGFVRCCAARKGSPA